jgi:hypothetical protein
MKITHYDYYSGKTPEQKATEIFIEYYRWVQVMAFNIDAEKLLDAIAIDMALTSVNFTLDSHNTKDGIIYWSKVKKELISRLPNGKLPSNKL